MLRRAATSTSVAPTATRSAASTRAARPAMHARPMSSVAPRQEEAYVRGLEVHGYRYQYLPHQMPVREPEVIEMCREMFHAAAEAPLGMIVLGPSRKLWIPSLLRNFTICSTINTPKATLRDAMSKPRWSDQAWRFDPAELLAFESLVEEQGDKGPLSGSVLFQLAGWSLALNDALIVGAACGEQDIHLAVDNSPVRDIDPRLLFDNQNKRPTVLARELGLLACSGYTRYQGPNAVGTAVLLPDTDNLLIPDLGGMLKDLESVRTYDDVLASTKPLEDQSVKIFDMSKRTLN